MATFTPTQQRMLNVLADGRCHSAQELHACLFDDLAPLSAIYFHVSNLRKVLQRQGEDIATVKQFGLLYYWHVRRIGSANQG